MAWTAPTILSMVSACTGRRVKPRSLTNSTAFRTLAVAGTDATAVRWVITFADDAVGQFENPAHQRLFLVLDRAGPPAFAYQHNKFLAVESHMTPAGGAKPGTP